LLHELQCSAERELKCLERKKILRRMAALCAGVLWPGDPQEALSDTRTPLLFEVAVLLDYGDATTRYRRIDGDDGDLVSI
jgi:hypothetical protein